jgi:hypothetical protein
MKLPILSEGVNEAPLVGCGKLGSGKLGWANTEKGMPSPHFESLF